MASIPEWLSLPHDLQGRIIARLPLPADRARFRAVCRSWRAVSPPKQLPWVVFSDGSFSTLLDSSRIHRLPFPENTTCVGSTNYWLALDRRDDVLRTHAYSLHNPFTGATVPLPELDSVIGNVPEGFQIRKVLMRSTPDDLVAVTCNIWRCPLILCRPGKGAWIPPTLTAEPYSRIIDVAFIGDKLYAITKDEDLFSFHIAEDDDGKPTISTVERVIRHGSTGIDASSDEGNEEELDDEDVDASSEGDGEELDDEDIDASSYEGNEEELDDEDMDAASEGNGEEMDDDEDVDASSEGNGEEMDDEASDEQDNYDVPSQLKAQVESAGNGMLSDCEEGVNQKCSIIATCRHLVESDGKLFMVRREWHCSAFTPTDHTRKVEVFEADVDAGTWVPVANGLGGHAIFISRCFSRFVPACGEVEQDLIYFPDSNDVFDMRTRTVRPLGPMRDDNWRVWVFPPDLVV